LRANVSAFEEDRIMRFVKVDMGSGAIVGQPQGHPAFVTLPNGAVVGSAHWTVDELAEHGWLRVIGEADPARETETGYALDTVGEDGAERLVARPILTPRSAEDLAAELAAKRAAAIREIDAAAERAREQFMTPGAGQALTYQRKLEEARAYANDAAGPFPLLEASIGADGPDIAAVAATVLATAEAWSIVAAQIEGQRLRAKRAVAAAETQAAIAAELAALTWPTP
jgi:hypothetical protein